MRLSVQWICTQSSSRRERHAMITLHTKEKRKKKLRPSSPPEKIRKKRDVVLAKTPFLKMSVIRPSCV